MDSICIDFDSVLIGRKTFLNQGNFFKSSATGANEQKALLCIRYVLEDIMHWTPQESVVKLDGYMIRILKLDRLLSYINYPVEVPYGHPRYILSRIYPDTVRISARKLTEEVFQTVLRNTGKEGMKQFPREYFAGRDGFLRYCTCVAYLMENVCPMRSIDDMYSFFMSANGSQLLSEYRLRVPGDQFSIDILDVVHYLTRDNPDSFLLYQYYQFERVSKQVRKRKERQTLLPKEEGKL